MQKDKKNGRSRNRLYSVKFFPLLPLILSLSICLLVLPNKWVAPLSGSPSIAGADETGTEEKNTPAPKKTDPSVTVYVTSWCPACSMAINYLKQKKVPFTVKDIEKNPDYLKEMVNKIGGYRGVPVLDINGKAYLGFHPSLIDQLAD